MREIEEFRIVEHPGLGFEPQQRWNAGLTKGEFWFPLTADGYWLQPYSFSSGQITQHLIFTEREDAERVLLKAKAIRGIHLRDAANRDHPPAHRSGK